MTMTFVVGLIVGVALGTIVIGFLALSAYESGYEAARTRPWRAELGARRARATQRPPVIAGVTP